MASINSITISGVRSFNPQNPQTVTFHKPLTVILGRNGAGKTSIIEALLYATTGEMPPGASAAEKSSFIYDPRVAGAASVKAQIRLNITGTDGTPMSVTRSFEARRTNVKTTFTALDSTIQTVEEDGSKRSQSYRASDCDALVPQMLGVSRAVLEHVVFCHQEESNWPLEAPSALKAKFDEIFSATRYVAALDKLKEIAKKKREEVAEFRAEEAALRATLDECRRILADIAEKEREMSDTTTRAREADPKIARVEAAIASLDSIAHNAAATAAEISTIEGRIAEKERALAAIAAKLGPRHCPPQQPLPALRDMRTNFDSHMKKLGDTARQEEEKLRINTEAKAQVERTIAGLVANREFMQREEQVYKMRVLELSAAIAQIRGDGSGPASRMGEGVVLGDGAVDVRALQRLESEVQTALTAARDDFKHESAAAFNRRGELAQTEAALQRDLDGDAKELAVRSEALGRLEGQLREKEGAFAACDGEAVATYRKAFGGSAAITTVFGAPADVAALGQPGSPFAAVMGTATAAVADAERRVETAAAEARRAAAAAASAAATPEQLAAQQEEAAIVSELSTIHSRLVGLRNELRCRSAEAEEEARLKFTRQQAATLAEELRGRIATTVLPTLAQLQRAAGLPPPQVLADGSGGGGEGSVPLSSITLATEQLRNRVAAAADKARAREATCNQASIAAAHRHKSKLDEIAEKERALNRANAQFAAAAAARHGNIAAAAFDQHAAATMAQHREACDRASSLSALHSCFGSFVQTARAEHKCVVCDRSLTDAALVDFVAINEDRQKTAPATIAAAQAEASRLGALVADFRTLEPIARDIARLSAEIPAARRDAAHLDLDAQAAANALKEAKAAVAGADADCAAVDQLASLVGGLNHSKTEIERLEREAQRMDRGPAAAAGGGGAAAGAGGNAQQPLSDLQAAHDADVASSERLSDRLQALRRAAQERAAAMEAARRRMAAPSVDDDDEDDDNANNGGEGDAARQLQRSLDAKRDALRTLQHLRARAGDIAAAVAQLRNDRGNLATRVAELQARRVTLDASLAAARREIEDHRGTSKAAVDRASAAVALRERNAQLVAACSHDIRAYAADGKDAKLRAIREQIARAEATVRTEAEGIAALQHTLQKSRTLLDDQQRAAATIDGSIAYWEAESETRDLQGRKQDLARELAALKEGKLRDVRTILGSAFDMSLGVDALRSQLHQKQIELGSAKAQHQGAVDAIARGIRALRDRHAEQRFDRIDDRHLTAFIKLHTTELAVKDLEKYHTALDKAVQSYHHEKIAQINQIIANYWRATYRGSDIDTIEIKSEDSPGAAPGASSGGTRRTYQYRVVMRRGNKELDMRGRCSAGQKVLASVVIRLALSEAFCCDCGVLALDEPTTNLDEDNALALATSLKDLIAARRTTSNFLLIVITHDESFVRGLGGTSVDTYYYVSKDRAGAFSMIETREFGRSH